MTTQKVKLPYRLSFVPGTCGMTAQFRPGRGEAGWTVGEFDSKEAALEFMQQHPEAAMPCWKRFQ